MSSETNPKLLRLANIERLLRSLDRQFDEVQRIKANNVVLTTTSARLIQEIDAYRRRELTWKYYINRYRAALGMPALFKLPTLEQSGQETKP